MIAVAKIVYQGFASVILGAESGVIDLAHVCDKPWSGWEILVTLLTSDESPVRHCGCSAAR